MLSALRSASAGMTAGLIMQDILANNVANVTTAGYKRDAAVLHGFQKTLAAELGRPAAGAAAAAAGEVSVSQVATYFTDGPIRPTGNELDVAIVGKGFFVVEAGGGEAYTRAGNFTLDSQRQLVTPAGYPVLGQGGPIQLPPGKVVFGEDGAVIVEGNEIDKLRIVTFQDESQLVKDGSGVFRGGPRARPQEGAEDVGTVHQGCLEQSNVSAVREMVDMIAAFRYYEANAKALQTADSLLDKAVNDIGRNS